MLFEAMKDGGPHHKQAVDVYCRHIHQRTGGNEKRSEKGTIADYLAGAIELFASMRVYGFDPDQPVGLGNNLNLRGGAHRLACALVLDEPVHVCVINKPGNAAPWDEAFMHARGMSDADLEIINDRFHDLRHAARLRVG